MKFLDQEGKQWKHKHFQAVLLVSGRGREDTSVDQVFQFGVNQREHDGAGAIQDGSALEQSSGFGAPRLRLEIEVDGVQCHSEEVSDQSHGFGVQPRKKRKKTKTWIYVQYKLKSMNLLFVAS